jgi:hypothetical protein
LADPIYQVRKSAREWKYLGALLVGIWRVHKARHFIKSRLMFAKEKNEVIMDIGRRNTVMKLAKCCYFILNKRRLI